MSAGLLSAALAADFGLGEPPAPLHPVVALGGAIGALERLAPSAPRSARAYGVLLPLVPAAIGIVAAAIIARLPRGTLRAAATVYALKSSFALRELLDASARVERALSSADLAAARRECRALVSRPTMDLSDSELSSAAIESLAENLADSYVAPLLFYRVGGLAAALAYRAVNTADAMVGYRGRYEHLGKAAARADDLLNLLPSRLSALALILATPVRRRAALRVAVRDHARTASPNAGWPMAAAAGALDLRLAKRGHYALGSGRRPVPADIGRARRLVAAAAVLFTLAVLASYGRVRP